MLTPNSSKEEQKFYGDGYWSEFGEIVTNVFYAVWRGELHVDDVRDYLEFITQGNSMELFKGLEKVRVKVENVESVLISIFTPYKQNYYEYIKSPVWKKKADAAKERADYRCQICNRHQDEVQLDAHHRTYERLGHERNEDITVLCHDCHGLYENNKKQHKQKARAF